MPVNPILSSSVGANALLLMRTLNGGAIVSMATVAYFIRHAICRL